MRFSIIFILTFTAASSLHAQVKNEVPVYIRPGTDVNIFENVTNAGSGSITVDEGAQLYVQGSLVNNGSMTFNNSASLLRGSTGNDGTGSGTYFVKRQGTTNNIVYNFWSSPMTSYSGVPGSPSYKYDSDLSTQDFADDQDPDPGWISYNGSLTPGAGYAGRGAGLYTFSGDVNNGNVDFPLVYHPYAPGNTAAGTPFNLVGNPYPSAISCASLVAANADINGSLYFWDDDLTGGSGYTSSDYAVWNGTGSLGTGAGTVGAPNGYVSTGQGFLVRALNGSAVLNLTNAMRAANNNTQFFRTDDENSRLWFSIEGDGIFNQILIGMLTDATDHEDRLYDAVKMRGNVNISLSAESNDRDYAILAFPPPSEMKTIPLAVFTATDGIYRFHANSMESFDGYDVYFTDLRTSEQVLLEEGTQIEVSLAAGDHDGRFFLNFVPNGINGIQQGDMQTLTAYCYQGLVHIQSHGDMKNASVQLIDMQGRKIFERTYLLFSSGEAIVDISGVASGIYVLRAAGNGLNLSQKIIKD